MSSFDGWEARLYGDAMALPLGQLSDNELMHFRTKGSKNGVRRYQQPDGTWTPLGLKERKAREGWGETRKERKAAKAVAKAEKKAEKAERKASKSAARAERMAAAKQKLHKNDLRNLSDEELQKKIARVKMELEYKELTKSPILKNGEKIVTGIIEARARKAEREQTQAKMNLESKRVNAEVVKAKENTKRAKADAEKARYEAQKTQADVRGGLKTEREAKLIQAKIGYKATTIRGGISKRINQMLSAGVSDKMKAKRVAEGKVLADRVLVLGQESEAKRQAGISASEQKAQAKALQKAKRKQARQARKFNREYGLDGNLN